MGVLTVPQHQYLKMTRSSRLEYEVLELTQTRETQMSEILVYEEAVGVVEQKEQN